MDKGEMKNRISMALKDPILQQGFECICKENAALKDKIGMLDLFCGGDSFKQRRLDTFIQVANYFEKLEKENAELKNERNAFKIYSDGAELDAINLNKQLTKTKDLLLRFIDLKNKPCAVGHSVNMLLYENICADADQFLNSEVEK